MEQAREMAQPPTVTSSLDPTLPSPTISDAASPYNIHMSEWFRSANQQQLDGLATGGLIFDSHNRVLLIQRAASDSMPNLWETPGGAVDDTDTTILAGCAREVFEESGLVVTTVRRVVAEGPGLVPGSMFTNRSASKKLCKLNFEVEVESVDEIKLDANEHQGFVWAEESEVVAGKVGELPIPLTGQQQRNILMEAWRLRREAADAITSN